MKLDAGNVGLPVTQAGASAAGRNPVRLSQSGQSSLQRTAADHLREQCVQRVGADSVGVLGDERFNAFIEICRQFFWHGVLAH
ncbi:hypothetical protein C667_07086 [Thauera phenylacetica B4P]|uniref:Uncharacterized protein n=1 Tax=Thauera phenylacetica B4P TaxID=1234382 RepID=N6YU11_9RHOO|nr:hypothetical protein C667_07086 [Thauera phenylacetica B4P]